MWGCSGGDHARRRWSGGGLWHRCSIVVVAQKALMDSSGMGRAVGAGLLLRGKFPMRLRLKAWALWLAPPKAVVVVVRRLVPVGAQKRVRVL